MSLIKSFYSSILFNRFESLPYNLRLIYNNPVISLIINSIIFSVTIFAIDYKKLNLVDVKDDLDLKDIILLFGSIILLVKSKISLNKKLNKSIRKI